MIKFTCRHYATSQPCTFNKSDGSECPTCGHFSEYGDRVLFIKLDSIGDVLRSASLLPAIISRHDRPYVAWLTRKESVDLARMLKHVDEVIELSDVGIARIMAGGWDCVYSLSNDLPSASIATIARPKNPVVGYYVEAGIIKPSNAAAERWLEMAAFDRLKRANTQTYQRHMMSILGADDAEISPPGLVMGDDLVRAAKARIAALFGGKARPRIALNIGAGSRWPKKMLNAMQICRYLHLLRDRIDADVLLVGGAAEAEKAKEILAHFDACDSIKAALTERSLAEFVAILNEADVLVCGDTLALHVATAIGLPAVAVFGPTSPAEIADFDGLVAKAWTDRLDCLICYGDCSKENNCMLLLDPETLIELTKAQLARGRRKRDAGARNEREATAR
jgi:ADP-heptose:LPS heptosyltransferase